MHQVYRNQFYIYTSEINFEFISGMEIDDNTYLEFMSDTQIYISLVNHPLIIYQTFLATVRLHKEIICRPSIWDLLHKF